MSWMDKYDGVFFISLATILVSAIGISLKYCFKSKCEDVNVCCGMVKIKRNVEIELQQTKEEIDAGISSKEEEKNNV